MALISGRDVEPGDAEGAWRTCGGTAKDRIISTVDPDSRHVHKTVRARRDGFKAHVAVEPETGLVTDCALTAGNTYDGDAGVALLDRENEPVQVLADSAYGSAARRKTLTAAGHAVTIKPIPLHHTVPGGCTLDDFTVDTTAATVTCPAGHTARIEPAGRVQFLRRCQDWPAPTLHQQQGGPVDPGPRGLRSSARAAPPPTPPGSAPTPAGVRCWNAPSPGSWPRAIDVCATAASPATSCGWTIATPP